MSNISKICYFSIDYPCCILYLLEIHRLSLEGRKSRIVVVLIQKLMPAVDDTITTERAASLCEACTLNPKALFILPVVDNIHGYAIR